MSLDIDNIMGFEFVAAQSTPYRSFKLINCHIENGAVQNLFPFI